VFVVLPHFGQFCPPASQIAILAEQNTTLNWMLVMVMVCSSFIWCLFPQSKDLGAGPLTCHICFRMGIMSPALCICCNLIGTQKMGKWVLLHWWGMWQKLTLAHGSREGSLLQNSILSHGSLMVVSFTILLEWSHKRLSLLRRAPKVQKVGSLLDTTKSTLQSIKHSTDFLTIFWEWILEQLVYSTTTPRACMLNFDNVLIGYGYMMMPLTLNI